MSSISSSMPPSMSSFVTERSMTRTGPNSGSFTWTATAPSGQTVSGAGTIQRNEDGGFTVQSERMRDGATTSRTVTISGEAVEAAKARRASQVDIVT